MPTIVVRCPVCRNEVTTGIDIEVSIFINLPKRAFAMKCCACQMDVVWMKSMARLVEFIDRDVA